MSAAIAGENRKENMNGRLAHETVHTRFSPATSRYAVFFNFDLIGIRPWRSHARDLTSSARVRGDGMMTSARGGGATSGHPTRVHAARASWRGPACASVPHAPALDVQEGVYAGVQSHGVTSGLEVESRALPASRGTPLTRCPWRRLSSFFALRELQQASGGFPSLRRVPWSLVDFPRLQRRAGRARSLP